jgi:hypothetical protein
MKRQALVFVAIVGALALPAVAAPPVVTVVPTNVRFGRQPLETETKTSFTITNQSDQTLLVTIEQVEVWDDFSPGQVESTCPLGESFLPAGQSCYHVIGFRPSLFFLGRETSLMRVTAHDESGTTLLFERDVKLTGTGVTE